MTARHVWPPHTRVRFSMPLAKAENSSYFCSLFAFWILDHPLLVFVFKCLDAVGVHDADLRSVSGSSLPLR